MSDTAPNALHAAVRALDEVVSPALEQSQNPLAQEQARLVGQYLGFLAERWDDFHDMAVFQLHHQILLGEQILAVLREKAPDEDHTLAETLAEAIAIYESQHVSPATMDVVRKQVLSAISAVVRDFGENGSSCLAQIEELITRSELELIGLHRAWFLPQGWESGMADLPDLDIIHSFRSTS